MQRFCINLYNIWRHSLCMCVFVCVCFCVCVCVCGTDSKTVWKYPWGSTPAPLILSALCKAGSTQGEPISDYPRWLAALSAAMGECLAVTSSLIGGHLSSGAGSEVTEDQRKEMLAYDWFMSDSLTQPGRQSRRQGQGVKVSHICCIGLVALAMVIGLDSIRISIILIITLCTALYTTAAAWKSYFYYKVQVNKIPLYLSCTILYMCMSHQNSINIQRGRVSSTTTNQQLSFQIYFQAAIIEVTVLHKTVIILFPTLIKYFSQREDWSIKSWKLPHTVYTSWHTYTDQPQH